LDNDEHTAFRKNIDTAQVYSNFLFESDDMLV
jgi:hypothetical protein